MEGLEVFVSWFLIFLGGRSFCVFGYWFLSAVGVELEGVRLFLVVLVNRSEKMRYR